MRYKSFLKIKRIKRIFLSHPEYIILFITTCISLLYFAWGINSWKFSFVGDEWSSYTFAKEYAGKNFLINPFSFNGVYYEHSVLASLYQAVSLKILGYSNFAWKFSNIILIVPITIIFYLWIKKTFGTQVGFISTFILQSSFYLSNYFKNGTIQPECLTLFIISLYLASICSTKPMKKNLISLGLILGISFYIYLGPLFLLILSPYLFHIVQKSYKKKKIISTLIFLFSPYLLLLLPLMFSFNQVGNGPLLKTVASREYNDNFQILINIFHNFLLFYKNYDLSYNHFVAGPYLDVVSRILALLGTIIIIINFRKKEYLILLLAYVLTCIIIGATSPYSYAPTNRGIFFLPFGFAFAGIALERIIKFSSWKIAYIIIPLIFIINVYQSQIGVFKQVGYTDTGLVIKSLQEAKENNSKRKITLLLSKDSNYNYQNIYIMQQAYGLEKVNFETIKTNQLRCSILKNTDILFFDYDLEAKNTISLLACPPQFNFSKKSINPKP